jgi:hemerythrin
MNVKHSDRQVFEEIRDEHEALRKKLGKIHQVLAAPCVRGDEVASLLFDLRKTLATHFENEEHKGFFDDITTHAPRLNPQAKRLCSEHVEILHTASELAQFASVGIDSKASQRELGSRFHTLSKQLMDHESEENALLQQAYQEDIGGHD